MKGYIVCVYESIKDDETLKKYAIKARTAVEKHDGKFLIRGGKNIVTEGKNYVRTVVIEFESFNVAKKFFNETSINSLLVFLSQPKPIHIVGGCQVFF